MSDITISFTAEEWAIIHDFLTTSLAPMSAKVQPYNGYDCLRTRIRYGQLSDTGKEELLQKLGLK